MTEALSDGALRLLLAIAKRGTWTTWDDLVRDLGGKKAPATLTADMSALIRGGAIQTRGSMGPAELAAELKAAMIVVKRAQAEGTAMTWKTRQTISYALSKSGADMANLVAQRT